MRNRLGRGGSAALAFCEGLLAFRGGKDMHARVALHVLAVVTVAALVVLATGLTTVQASIVTPLGWGA